MWQLGPEADQPEWQVVETPFTNDLFEVVQTKVGPYAVGDGGVIAGNRNDSGWEVILDDGPNASDNQLRSLGVTDGGRRIWFAGSSGALGCYDVETRRKYDYSYPNEMTSTWEGIAAAGRAGKEKLLIANGSGEILPVAIDGFDVNWGVTSKPGGQGSKMAALAASPDGVGYAVDTNGNAFMTTKEEGWEDIGIVNAQVKFYDIWAGANQKVYVAAGNSRLYRYDDSYKDWTPIGVGDGASLRSFDMLKDQMMALGSDGVIYERIFGGERWESMHSPTSNTLYDLRLGSPDIAVGKGGTVIKRPDKPRHSGGDVYEGRGETYDADENEMGEQKDDDPGDSSSGDGSSSDGSSSDGSSSDGSTSDGSSSG